MPPRICRAASRRGVAAISIDEPKNRRSRWGKRRLRGTAARDDNRRTGDEFNLSARNSRDRPQAAGFGTQSAGCLGSTRQGRFCRWRAPDEDQADHWGRRRPRDAVSVLHHGHTKAAVRAGATPEELMEAIWVAAEMRAGAASAHSTLMLARLSEEEEEKRTSGSAR